QTMLFYLKEEKYLVAGLNAEKSSIPTSKYPKTCENKPCLCLYKDSGVFPSEPYKCKIFPESVIFHGYGQEKLILIRGSLFSPTPSFSLQLQKQPAELYSDYPPELIIEYEGLALIAAKDFTHNLYIEKFVKDNRIHILVTPMFTQDEIDIRISVLSTCPLGSDQDCDGKRRNSFTDDAKTQYCYYDEANQRCLLKTDFKTCVFDQKVTADCLCGDEFASGSRGLYCFNRADGEIFLVPFNCKAPEYASISNKCPLYCGVLTQTEGCVGDEQYYCEKDPCGFGTESNPCIVEQKGSKIICKQKT
ncbi:MAG TPA: hypothetical protein VJ461_06860, partial [Candidatus Nanoarchaeia archaeon]|nr:hypothetical protein [Candidatus Nanoarchaeia archaeon]